jgi:hypothetical protein
VSCQFAASQTVRGRAAACSTVIRSVDSEGKPSDLPPEEVSVLPGGPLLDVDRLGIGEKARRLCSRGLLLRIRPVSPGNQIPHTVARIRFGGQVHDGDRLELHHFQVSMSGSAGAPPSPNGLRRQLATAVQLKLDDRTEIGSGRSDSRCARIAFAASSGETARIQRKSSGHSRRKHGLHST